MFKLIKNTRLNEQVEDVLLNEKQDSNDFSLDNDEDNMKQNLNFDVEDEIKNRDQYKKVQLANESTEKISELNKVNQMIEALLEDEDNEEDFDGDGEDDIDIDELELMDMTDEDLEDDDFEDDDFEDDEDEDLLLGENCKKVKSCKEESDDSKCPKCKNEKCTCDKNDKEEGELLEMGNYEIDTLIEELDLSMIELEGTISEFESEDDASKIYNNDTKDDIDEIEPEFLDVEPCCPAYNPSVGYKESFDFADELDSFLEELEADLMLEEDEEVLDERLFLTRDERKERKGEIQAAKDERRARDVKAGEAFAKAGDRYNAADAKYRAGIAANKEKYKAGKAANKEKYKARKAANFDKINKAGERFDDEFDKYYDKLNANKADYKAKKAEIKARYKAKKKEAETALKEAEMLAEMYELIEGTLAEFENQAGGSEVYNSTKDDINEIIPEDLDIKPRR